MFFNLSIAQIYDAQGKYEEALKLSIEALEIDKAHFGQNHPKVAIKLNK